MGRLESATQRRRFAATATLVTAALWFAGCGRPGLRAKDLVDAPPSGGMSSDGGGDQGGVTIVGFTPKGQTAAGYHANGGATPGAPGEDGMPGIDPSAAGGAPLGDPNAPAPVKKPEVSASLSKATAGDSTITSPAEGSAVASCHIQLAGSGHYLVAIDGSDTFIMSAGSSKDVPGVKAGPHILRAVPCDANGAASFDSPLSVREFTIGPTPQKLAGFQLKAPILTVGRPMGAMKPAEDSSIPFDIRIDGVSLSESGLQLYYKVDEDDPMVQTTYPPDKKQPIRLFALEPGKHTLTVWIEDSVTKRAVDNAGLGRVVREFTVQ